MDSKPFSASYRVYWEDTDAGGVVYHANYIKFMERARTEWLRDKGIVQDPSGGIVILVAGLSIDFKRPARLNDLLTVECEVEELRRASVTVRQRILRGEELIAQGSVRCAVVDTKLMRPVAIPETIASAIR